MSPVIGLFIAVLAGLLAPRPRATIGIAIPPMLGATAAQSWFLATGRGTNPPRTTTDSPSYWVVQLLIITAICGMAAAVCRIRVGRGAGARRLPTGVARSVLLTAATAAASAATLGALFLTDQHSHRGTGSGNIPITGAIAVGLGVVVLIVVAIGWVRRSRQPVQI